MEIFPLGFANKSAQEFFECIKENKIDLVLDTRLKNQAPQDGFTRKRDLPYFLQNLCGSNYEHDLILSPTEDQNEIFQSSDVPKPEYFSAYRRMLEMRQAIGVFFSRYGKYERVCILFSKTNYAESYVSVLLEMLKERNSKIEVKML